MKIAITGSSGLIGTALRAALGAEGHEIHRVVRRQPRGDFEIGWDPAARHIDPARLDGLDAVVHLAGVGLGDHRWTAAHKRSIRDSRIDATTTISTAFTATDNPPKLLLSASAIGWYGDTGDLQVDEKAPAGRGFLARLCADWEAATQPARDAGARVVTLRSGLVLTSRGGLMARMVPLFSLGVGGRLGPGTQYWSWVSLTDEVAAIRFLLTNEVTGPVNITGPVPVTNEEFTRALAAALHRPAKLPVPSVALRAVLGEFADEAILIGQRAVPAALSAAGFNHTHRTVEAAIRHSIDRDATVRPAA